MSSGSSCPTSGSRVGKAGGPGCLGAGTGSAGRHPITCTVIGHVYMDSDGQSILVSADADCGFAATSAGGIIAHNCHTSPPAISAALAKGLALAKSWRTWSEVPEPQLRRLAPLVWLVRLYHHVYFRLYFASQRDGGVPGHFALRRPGGRRKAATTLVLINVLDHIPSANLANMAENLTMFNQRVDNFFAERE